ncbi:MAG TPA: hypothetical protein VK116_00810, partial [Planctomycetota bacterium]|nr:hypothetical protein [Planctomycetota bacterium]
MKPGDPEARPEESGTESGTESGEEAIAFAVLGASNLTHAFPQAIRAIVRRLPNRPAILHVAHGPGRSYGLDAGILGITFRGHRESVLRERIDAERGRVKLEGAILTDIGNDIPYEVPVPTILEWVGEIVRSLVSRGARVGITRLPVEAVRDLPSWRFRMLLPLFYPRCRLSREEIFARMVAVEQGLDEIAARMPEV